MKQSIKIDKTGIEIKGTNASKIFVEYNKKCFEKILNYYKINGKEPNKEKFDKICGDVLKELNSKYTKDTEK